MKGQTDTEPAAAGADALHQHAEHTAVTTGEAQKLAEMMASSDIDDDSADDGEGEESTGVGGVDAFELIHTITDVVDQGMFADIPMGENHGACPKE